MTGHCPDVIGSPQVSIVIAFLNAEMFIEETLNSVVNQTLDDWELILVNDGSSDNSERIVKTVIANFPDKMVYLTHENAVNKGVCASRNLGIRHARGQYIALLDADDVWQPGKLAEQTAVLHSHTEVGMVFGASRYWNSWSKSIQNGSRDFTPRLGLKANCVHPSPTLLIRCHPLGNASAPCPSDIMLRREIVEKVGGFEEAFTGSFQMYEDQAFLAKVYLNANVYVSDSTWTYYRLHTQSCCHRVTSSGEETAVKQFYLDWLRTYLDDNGVKNDQISRALEKANRTNEALHANGFLTRVLSVVRSSLQRWLR